MENGKDTTYDGVKEKFKEFVNVASHASTVDLFDDKNYDILLEVCQASNNLRSERKRQLEKMEQKQRTLSSTESLNGIDRENLGRVDNAELLRIHMERVTSTYGESIDALRKNSSLSEDACAQILIDAISNEVDMMNEEEKLRILRSTCHKKSRDKQDLVDLVETIHSKRQRERHDNS